MKQYNHIHRTMKYHFCHIQISCWKIWDKHNYDKNVRCVCDIKSWNSDIESHNYDLKTMTKSKNDNLKNMTKSWNCGCYNYQIESKNYEIKAIVIKHEQWNTK